MAEKVPSFGDQPDLDSVLEAVSDNYYVKPLPSGRNFICRIDNLVNAAIAFGMSNHKNIDGYSETLRNNSIDPSLN